jgi:hypothetical protein
MSFKKSFLLNRLSSNIAHTAVSYLTQLSKSRGFIDKTGPVLGGDTATRVLGRKNAPYGVLR